MCTLILQHVSLSDVNLQQTKKVTGWGSKLIQTYSHISKTNRYKTYELYETTLANNQQLYLFLMAHSCLTLNMHTDEDEALCLNSAVILNVLLHVCRKPMRQMKRTNTINHCRKSWVANSTSETRVRPGQR